MRKIIRQTLKTRNDNFIYKLITQLVSLLDKNWEKLVKVFTFLAFYNDQNHKLENNDFENKIHSLQIFATFIQKVNDKNLANFSSTSKLDIKNPKIYK